MKLAIVEDDKIYQMHLLSVLNRIKDIIIDQYYFAYDFLNSNQQYDLCILDIDLPDMSGIELKEHMTDKHARIIFLTSYSNPMQQAFGINVVGYVLKSEADSAILEKIKKELNSIKTNCYVTICASDENYQIRPSDIILIQHEGRKCKVVTVDKCIYVSSTMTLKDLYAIFQECLIYCNKSCLVNPFHIKSNRMNTLTMDNGMIEYIARDRARKFKYDVLERVTK